MAQDRITLDLTRSQYNYIAFIRNVRQRARDPQRYSHNVAVLPVPPQNPQQAEFITLELRAGGPNPLIVQLRRHDLYFIGYQMQNGQWFEFQRDDNVHLIQGSQYLAFGENYMDLGGLAANTFQVGYNMLANAINRLPVSNDNDERRRSLRILCVMICEASRFTRLSDTFANLVQNRADAYFEGWMDTLIHSWGDLSDRLLRSDVAPPIGFRLPPRADGTANALSENPINIQNADSAIACLGILLGSFVAQPRMLTSITTTGVDPSFLSVGQPMVEVFSVRINNIDDENPGDLYGTIQVTDGLGSFYIYNKARSDYESIRPDETATLVGPYRAISLAQSFMISLNLMDKDADLSPDDEISKGYVFSDIYSLNSTLNKFDKPLSRVVNGKYGKATMYYAILRNALEASIQVVLVNGDGEDPANVYGSVVARYRDDFYSSIARNEKKYCQSLLFNKTSKNYVNVRPESAIPLSRSVVAVPTNSSLVVKANLWDYDTLSPDDEVAKGIAEFYPLPNMSTEKEINGRYGKVTVRVSWSPISGGLN